MSCDNLKEAVSSVFMLLVESFVNSVESKVMVRVLSLNLYTRLSGSGKFS